MKVVAIVLVLLATPALAQTQEQNLRGALMVCQGALDSASQNLAKFIAQGETIASAMQDIDATQDELQDELDNTASPASMPAKP